MLIRVRSNVGLWRVDGLDANTATVHDVMQEIAKTRPHVVYLHPLSKDPACQQVLNDQTTLASQGLQHGSMIHCRVDPSTCVDITVPAPTVAADESANTEGMEVENNSNSNKTNNNNNSGASPASSTLASRISLAQPQVQQQRHMKRVIDKDGTIRLVPSTQAMAPGEDKGFRKGMLPLRDMKMHWTLADFVALDSQFEFNIKRQETAVCRQVSLDVPSIASFQAYIQRFQFQRKRFGWCYGKFVPIVNGDNDDNGDEKKQDKKNDDKEIPKPSRVIVEAIYEPPQEVDPDAAEGFILPDDPDEAKVDQIAELLGLEKVGWIYGHEAREKGFVMSASEVIMAAEFQLEAAGGPENTTPFVTVKVTPGENGTVSVEAFQVSQQCMAMVAEQALEVGPDPKCCVVNETFTAIQEGKASKTVENNFFLTVVPIVQHTSDMLVAEFPRANRDLDDRIPSNDEMKRHLQKSGTAGWTFEDRLADLNLLLYLSQYLDLNSDFPKLCASVVDRSIPLDDGYKLIIKSIAGMDGSY